ncbi:hypothetical protein [Halobellus rufus]|uniref:hypothetical protein n=1 Tax=Halobellus rufus TaxID=1448860 RepID=UPI000678984B|nr:hypothetical protein [Halobellus rufus]
MHAASKLRDRSHRRHHAREVEESAEIRERLARLHSWTAELAESLRSCGVETYPTETYFFLADVSPHDAGEVARSPRDRDVYVEPMDDERLGDGYLPADGSPTRRVDSSSHRPYARTCRSKSKRRSASPSST